MTELTRISVISSAETAVKKLKKAEIGIYDCKRQGTRFIFSVKDKHVKKVFAIFSKPCYNIKVDGLGRRARVAKTLLNRIGLAVGAVIFAAAAAFSNSFIFKISVSGSGSYLSNEVKRIIYESGVKEFKLYRNFDLPMATGKILALPSVTFCNIKKRGSVLKVDVQVDGQYSQSARRTPLIADRSGAVKRIVAVCGTAAVSVGDRVHAGDTLIAAYTLAGEEKIDCLAAGFAELECSGTVEYPAPCESDENLKAAYASVNIDAEKIVTRSHKVRAAEEGVVYTVEFTYLYKLSINME